MILNHLRSSVVSEVYMYTLYTLSYTVSKLILVREQECVCTHQAAPGSPLIWQQLQSQKVDATTPQEWWRLGWIQVQIDVGCPPSPSHTHTHTHTHTHICIHQYINTTTSLLPLSLSISHSFKIFPPPPPPPPPLSRYHNEERYVCEVSLVCQTLSGGVFGLKRLSVYLSSLVCHARYSSLVFTWVNTH